MEFLEGFLFDLFRILPLVSGAYISISIYRFPDLTIEASWSIAAIVSCMFVTSLSPHISLILGVFVGAFCGLLTSLIFVLIGRAKLLSGLISFFLLTALGYHLLGNTATIHLDSQFSKFGFTETPNPKLLSHIYYYIISFSALIVVFIWQNSKLGIKARLLGENPKASNYYKLSLNKHFSIGLIISNALVGLGGALYGLYEGMATNSQGIGHIIIAFFALLTGDELLRITKLSKRSIPSIILTGAVLYALLVNLAQSLMTDIQRLFSENDAISHLINANDKLILLGLTLLLILWARRNERIKKTLVSEW